MKQLAALLAAVILLFSLIGCQREDFSPTEPSPVLPTETEAPPTAGPTEAIPTEAPSTEPEPPETTAPTQPLPEPESSELVKVTDYIPTIRQELAYATMDNFSGQRIYDFTDAYLRYGTVKKLSLVCEELAQQGLGILIWDGFRPVSAQAALWEICPDPAYVSHPVTGNRSHCRGSAVDLTLVELETGEALPMPTGFDNFTAYADRDYSDCSPEAAENALLLEQTMEKYGFKPYFAEWWHYTDTDTYPVEEYFDPAQPCLWEANCQEYISLRSAPGSAEVLTTIPTGGTFSLLQWEEKYAKVSYDGQEGYVLTSYILPAGEGWLEQALGTVAPTDAYTYDQMIRDIGTLEAAYPEELTVESIGTSAQGRSIPVLRIGSTDARYHVLLQGAIHGREHSTAWLLMAMADYWLDHDLLSYGNICWHIIPMVNPDGVTISQTGFLEEAQQAIYERDLELGYTELDAREYAALWKANAQGIDLNRNFSSGWDAIDGRDAPSSQQYRGEAPFCAPETQALRDYTLAYSFDAAVSYHAHGSLIYWEYGNDPSVNALSGALGTAVSTVSGYPLADSSGVDGAGYKDWAMDALGIPSLTIEVGCQDAPLPEREIYSIFVRNFRILPAIARWLPQ